MAYYLHTEVDEMIETRDLTITLGDHCAVRDVSLKLNSGELVGLIGPNGAGKTTLMRALLRLTPIDKGEIFLDGKEITHDPAHAHAGQISYLPQGQNIAWPLTGKNLVALGRVPHQTSWSKLSAEDEAVIDAAMDVAQATEFADRPVRQLSGGERARILLARALAVGAGTLLVDEPTAALDPYFQLTAMEALKATAQQGTSVCVILHDLNLATRYCDRLYLLNQGELIAHGKPQEVLSNANLKAVYHVDVDRDAQTGLIISHHLTG